MSEMFECQVSVRRIENEIWEESEKRKERKKRGCVYHRVKE